MKIHFWAIGKAHESYVKEGIDTFTKRISHYYPVDWKIIPSQKNGATLSPADLKKAEAAILFSSLAHSDILVVLDEKGTLLNSEKVAGLIQLHANNSARDLIFLIGGAYGVDDSILKRANTTWGLSPLVFPHQLVRLILAEQVYRACTIIRNEKYHHS